MSNKKTIEELLEDETRDEQSWEPLVDYNDGGEFDGESDEEYVARTTDADYDEDLGGGDIFGDSDD